MLCPRCGTPNRAQATTCVRCHTALPAERSGPPAPSRQLDDGEGTTRGRVPIPTVAGLPERGMSGPAGGTKSSPWSPETEGGTLGASVLDELEEEVTVLQGMQVLESPTQSNSGPIPRIAEVGFAGPTQAEHAGRRSLERSDTVEVDLAAASKKGQWEDIISATEGPASERWGRPDAPTAVPLTEQRSRPPPSPTLRRPMIPERKDTSPTHPGLSTPPAGPRGMPRFGPDVQKAPSPAGGPARPAPIAPSIARPPPEATTTPARTPELRPTPKIPEAPPRPPLRVADPKTLPSMPPSKSSLEGKALPSARPVPLAARPTPPPGILNPVPAAPMPGPAKIPTASRPAPVPTQARPAIPAPSTRPAPPTAPAAPLSTRAADPPAPGPKLPTGASPAPRAPEAPAPILKTPTNAAAAPPRPAKAPTSPPRPSIPDTDDLLLFNPPQRVDDEPPGEETRLGQLASPLLVSPPVHGAQHLANAVGGQTVAAPGELAGLLDHASLTNPPVLHVPESPPGELSGVAADLSLPRPPPTVSQVERGLLAPLPPPVDVEPPPTPPPPRPLSLEPIDRSESSLSSIPLPDPPPLMRGVTLAPQVETQPLPGAAAAETLPPEAPAEAEVHLTVSPAWRRILAITIDLGLIGAITVVLAILGLFGEAAASPSLDPDVFTDALGKGHLNLAIGFVMVLGFVYSITAHALLGRSIGKLACGLELVANGTGHRPGVLRALWRGISTIPGVLLLGFGYFWLIMDRRNRTFHDRLSGTTVVVSASRRELGPVSTT